MQIEEMCSSDGLVLESRLKSFRRRHSRTDTWITMRRDKPRRATSRQQSPRANKAWNVIQKDIVNLPLFDILRISPHLRRPECCLSLTFPSRRNLLSINFSLSLFFLVVRTKKKNKFPRNKRISKGAKYWWLQQWIRRGQNAFGNNLCRKMNQNKCKNSFHLTRLNRNRNLIF